MICKKCYSEFVENRDVWPANICPNCRSKIYECTAEVEEYDRGVIKVRTRSVRRTRRLVLCGMPFLGTQLDPTEINGLVYCPSCRLSSAYCHHCGKRERIKGSPYDASLSNDLCKGCGFYKTFCPSCLHIRRGPQCIPASQKVPPSSFDPIDFTPMLGLVSSCSSSASNKPLFFGSGNDRYRPPNSEVDVEFSLKQAHDFAYHLFYGLVALQCRNPHIRKRFDCDLPASQNTMAITLLENDLHFRIILTYSEYDLSHVANAVKRNHATFCRIVIDANPEIVYKKREQVHYMDGVRYPIHDRNDHHAEMRACVFAKNHSYQIRIILPTKECCRLCHRVLTNSKLLGTVPVNLRFAEPTLIEKDHGGTLTDPEQGVTFTIDPIPGGGDCLFSALIRAGIVPASSSSSSGSLPSGLLRKDIASRILQQDVRERIVVDHAYVEDIDLDYVAAVIGRKIILYKAHYGEHNWYERSEHGDANGQAPIAIILRTIRGQADGHYDRLVY